MMTVAEKERWRRIAAEQAVVGQQIYVVTATRQRFESWMRAHPGVSVKHLSSGRGFTGIRDATIIVDSLPRDHTAEREINSELAVLAADPTVTVEWS